MVSREKLELGAVKPATVSGDLWLDENKDGTRQTEEQRLSGVTLELVNPATGNRAAAASIETKIGNHTFRATGITAYLKNGGTLEKAAAMANHSSTRTTQLYDRRSDEVTLDESEAESWRAV